MKKLVKFTGTLLAAVLIAATLISPVSAATQKLKKVSEKQVKAKNSVVQTFTFNQPVQKPSGWTLSNNKKTISKTFKESTKNSVKLTVKAVNKKYGTVKVSYKITIKKEKVKATPIVVTSIDNRPPVSTGDLKYYVEYTINTNVKPLAPDSSWTVQGNSITKKYTSNVQETITIKAENGTTVKQFIEINSIPLICTGIDNKGLNAKYIMHFNQVAKEENGWLYDGTDKKSLYFVFSSNPAAEVVFHDITGYQSFKQYILI
jgi:hypothetical protein